MASGSIRRTTSSCAADGTIWFTDPPYGLPQGETKELDGHFVFRHDPKSGKTTSSPAISRCPNGLALSPDGKKLYVADSGRAHQIWVYDVKADGSLAGGKVFCVIDKGGARRNPCRCGRTPLVERRRRRPCLRSVWQIVRKSALPRGSGQSLLRRKGRQNAVHDRPHVAVLRARARPRRAQRAEGALSKERRSGQVVC